MHHFSTNRLLFLLLFQAFLVTCCIERERQALLKFKGGVSDPSNSLASWRGDQCCNWVGVRCSNQTGHVVKLHLPNSINHSLHGEINHVLSFLNDLKHLDLSHNNFSGNKFPNFISSLRNLNYLNLSSTGLSGMIPPQLGNLSKLRYLDLSYLPDTFVSNAWWLSHLISLRHLDMSEVYLRDSEEWVQAMSKLPLLRTLILEENGLTTIPASINPVNFSSLQVLIIEDNCFNTRMPGWIVKLTNLKTLWLSYCCFIDQIPKQFGNLVSLYSLALADKRLKGPMPPLHNLKNLTQLYILDVNTGGETISDFMSKLANDCFDKLEVLHLENMSLTGNLNGWLSKMPNLNILHLPSNYLNGTVPSDVGNLTLLEQLSLENNSFTGDVSEIQLAGLSRLEKLSLHFNSIVVTVDRNWIPPFQLKYLFLRGCKVGPHFPSWLQNQSHLLRIGLANTGITNIPNWFWNFPSLSFVSLSENNISGRLPSSLEHLTQLNLLFLQKNLFVGTIPTLPNSLEFVNFSENFFHGTLNKLICKLDSLAILDLGNNNLSGNLPLCWPSTLEVVAMTNNKLSGGIPSSIGILSSLRVLQLSNNAFTGDLPSTLEFCRNLIILDIGENNLSGQIPEWIGKNLKRLKVLSLRSNMFSGEIPIQIMHLAELQVLDLASNHISGLIPDNLVFLHAMSSSTVNNTDLVSLNFSIDLTTISYIVDFSLRELIVTKNLEQQYTTNLALFKSIDLSGNHLIGGIPRQIITLIGLINLNLSNNHLHGSIPMQIGQMQSLESVDLSMNELSDMIPQSLTNLNFLSALNLSYNNLSGRIPNGNQLQTLDNPSIYMGNDYLCGSPLNKSCGTSENPIRYEARVGNDLEDGVLYLYVVLGFLLGFFVICGIMFFKEQWRYCFFRVVDDGFDKLCCVSVVM